MGNKKSRWGTRSGGMRIEEWMGGAKKKEEGGKRKEEGAKGEEWRTKGADGAPELKE